ncbi:MAG: CusA/CzcA family heavy metal efflux RND transporter [Bacteroidia bacterium]|nr:CusA/CzcA family heavy metal efflux RND transporter [Bacteroidia bacterium]NNK90736.1 efflux RND transporter permease subunit [Saprospiraceae bacterium]
MLNKIIEISLEYRLLVLAGFIMVMVTGGYIASEMDVDVFPDLTAPTVTIMTEAHGMATVEVERLVTFPIESSLNGAPNIRRIRSSSAMGISIIWAEFEWGTDIYKARQIVNEKLATAANKLPESIKSPVLAPISSIMGEIMFLSLSSDSLSPMELRNWADWNLRPQLLATQGVAQVIVIGGDFKQYEIAASPEKMKYYGISINELEEAAAASTRNASGGFINAYGNQFIIQGEGRTTSVQQIGETLIKMEGNKPVSIQDVAEVQISSAPKIGDGAVSGKPSVILTIKKQPTANTLKLTKRIEVTLEKFEQQLPEGVELNSHLFRQSDFIQASIDNLKRTLLEGGLFVSIILFLFLLNWRTTLISLLAIPVSLLVTIIALKLLGYTINTMSLGGMAIAIGALVDDAIIDVENIFKRLRENAIKPKDEKSSSMKIIYEASSEIRNSILIATLIIIMAFIPLFFLSGMEGRLLEPLGISFIVAIFTSLFVAVTLTPVLSSYLLINEAQLIKQAKGSLVERFFSGLYHSILKKTLAFPRSIIVSVLALFVFSMIVLSGLGRSFLPEFNEGALVVSVVTPPGTSLEESGKTGKLVEELLLEFPEVSITSRRTGRAEMDEHSQSANSSEVEVPFKLKDRDRDEFLDDIRKKLSIVPGANITIGMPIAHRIDHMLSGTRANIAIKIFGPELNRLFTIANKVKSAIEQTGGLVDVNVEQLIEVPQIRIIPNRVMLAKYGIKLGDFMDFIDVAFAGETVGQVFEGERAYDLVVRFNEQNRSNIEAIRNCLVDTETNEKIPLHYVANVINDSNPHNIGRENVQRKIVVSGNVSGRDLRSVVNDIQSRIDKEVTFPEGYRVEFGGQFENEAKATRMLMLTSIGAVIIIFLLLFLEFRILRLAGIVILNLPLALIGGIFSVYFTSGIISIASTIGFISLFGIAARNGILLISRYRLLEQQGMNLKDTILNGSLDRLNPILMTALTTGLALIPLAVASHQAGSEIQSPMAVVILGGLISSTILNLVVIPAIYSLK